MAILNLSYNSLQVIPKKTFPKLYELHTMDLSHNEISDIDGATLSNLGTLRHLNLSYNNMTTLGGSTIAFNTLVELDLSFNGLKDVSRSAFTRLPSIRSLYLQHNDIANIFQLPISLNELNLADNKISKIPPHRTWPVMNALLSLDLSNNQLGCEGGLEAGSFVNLISLQSLFLSNNSLSVVPWQALADMPSIQHIYFDQNFINELGRAAFGRLPVVFTLDLSRNNISSISDRAFEGLLQLLRLNLSSNAIEFIPPGAFHGLVSLRTLDLSLNSLEKLDNKTHSLLEDCLSLERVNLSQNTISTITPKTFPESPWIPYRLAEIDLSYNQLTVLTKELLIGTKKVKILSLRANQINEIRPGIQFNNSSHQLLIIIYYFIECFPGIFGNMTALQELDLSMNQLTHLAKGLISPLPNLTRLDLSSNLFVEIPIDDIVASNSLSLVDLRQNRLTRFYDEFMPLMERENGTRVLMEGNPVVCDCRLRPLQFWLSVQPTEDPWDKVICAGPPLLSGKAVSIVEDASLNCNRLLMAEQQQQTARGNKYAVFKDVVFRDVVRSGPSTIDVNWFVQTREDVGDFAVEVRGLLPESDQPDLVAPAVISKTLGYGLRSDKIDGVERHTPYAVCIRARDSLGYLRPWKPNQCQLVANGGSSTFNGRSQSLVATFLLFLGAFLLFSSP